LPEWGIFTWLKVKKEPPNKNNTKIARARNLGKYSTGQSK
jgi:hypothetical protein